MQIDHVLETKINFQQGQKHQRCEILVEKKLHTTKAAQSEGHLRIGSSMRRNLKKRSFGIFCCFKNEGQSGIHIGNLNENFQERPFCQNAPTNFAFAAQLASHLSITFLIAPLV